MSFTYIFNYLALSYYITLHINIRFTRHAHNLLLRVQGDNDIKLIATFLHLTQRKCSRAYIFAEELVRVIASYRRHRHRLRVESFSNQTFPRS